MVLNLFYISVLVSSLAETASHYILDDETADPVLLISFDGFRWDYLDMVRNAGMDTPNFNFLIRNGVTVDKPGITNTFVTKTFPNHYSIVTGMYEENHGVVGNYMYDPISETTFTLRNRNDTVEAFWFNNGSNLYLNDSQSNEQSSNDSLYSIDTGPDPIWNRNQRFGGKTGICYWPGSEAPVNDQRPYHYLHYEPDGLLTNESRIDMITDWLSSEDDPINLGLVYFNEPDHTGHEVGPESQHMLELVVELDRLVGYLIQKLKDNDLFDRINIIITSDHGMASRTHLVEMDSYIDPELYTVYGGSPIWNILPNEGKEEEVMEKLLTIPNVHVYRKEDIPRRYHYTYNTRILPILVEAAENYSLCHNISRDNCSTGGGIHGYNNSLPSMHPFFIAHGPAFRTNYTAPPFNNIDIYPLLCYLLDIAIPDNIDGQFGNIENLLCPEKSIFLESLYNLETVGITVVAVTLFVSMLGVILCCCACRNYFLHINKPQPRTIVKLDNIHMNDGKPLLLADSDDEDTAYSRYWTKS